MPISNIKFTALNKHLEFDINGIDVGFLNAIRRIILSEVPNVAIAFDSNDQQLSDIIFHENTSCLHNEFTGQRISLIPLCFNEKDIESFDKSKYKFIINEQGEKLVTSGDIKVFDENDLEVTKEIRDTIFPPDPITKNYIIISKLKNPNEKLHVEFRARKGIAKMHARWSPVSTCTYFNNLDEEAVSLARAQVNKDSPADVNKFETLDKYRLFSKNEFDEPNSFHVTIESECRMSPSYIFQKAINVLCQKLENLSSTSKLEVQVIDQDVNIYAVKIEDEDHTIGNLLQVSIYNDYVRKNDIVDFVGYFQPHPLESSIICKIRFFETNDDVIGFIQEAAKKAIEKLKAIELKATPEKKG